MVMVTKRLHYPANDQIVQVLRWRTAIRKHLDGTETRAALLTKPRESYRLNYRLGEDDMMRLMADLYNYTDDELWMVPQWWDPHPVTTASSTNINLTSINTDLVVGQWVYIEQGDGTSGEFRQSATVGSTLVTLTATLASSYTSGARMYPVRLVQQARDNTSVSRYPVELADAQVELAAYDFYVLGGAGATVDTWKSLNLLDREPQAESNPREMYNRGLHFFDQAARPGVSSWRSYADTLRPRSYLAKTRTELQWWKKFLDGCLGACVPFFAPTWTPDLVLDAQPASGASTVVIDISDTDFDAEWFGSTNSTVKSLQFLTNTADEVIREISSVTDNLDGTMDVDLVSALPAAAGLVISRVSFVERCRLDRDEVTIVHSPTSSRIDLVLRTVQEE